MFSRGVSPDMPAEDLVKADMKEFHLGTHSLAISQITTVDSEHFLPRSADFIEVLEKIRKEKQYDIVLMMITNDAISEQSSVSPFSTETLFTIACMGVS